MASRFLGLARDILLFASLGTGILNSAFILAYTIPNLFRRLLGEGALTSSTIPVLSESLEKEGRASTFHLLNAILGRLGLGLILLQFIAIPLFLVIHKVPGLEARWYAGAELSQVLFPYMLFICLGALVCGMLNVMGRFGLAAFNQVWLNVTMIIAMLAGILWLPEQGWSRVHLLCGGVILGGVLQLLIPAIGLLKEGWAPRPHLKPHPELGKVLALFLPGLLGAAIFQINILVSRFLAFSIDDTATGLLYIANRLVELPLGVFAIAVTTVVFPELSRLSSTGQEGKFADTLTRGLGLIFMITLPAMIGLVMLGRPILGFLFEWGLFESRDVVAAVPVLGFAALGLPFFAWSTLLTRAWYARQDMKVPVRLAALNLILNLVLGLILMQYMGAAGLALGNSLSSVVHCVLLQSFLPGRSFNRLNWLNLLKLVTGLVCLAATILLGQQLAGQLLEAGKLKDLVSVLAIIPAAASVYFAILWVTRYPHLHALAEED
jgi:putative peptidoglycan lipid II flippase